MKKAKKPTKKKNSGPTILDTLPKNRGEWLELVIEFTERAIHDPPIEADAHLRSQVTRLYRELVIFNDTEDK